MRPRNNKTIHLLPAFRFPTTRHSDTAKADISAASATLPPMLSRIYRVRLLLTAVYRYSISNVLYTYIQHTAVGVRIDISLPATYQQALSIIGTRSLVYDHKACRSLHRLSISYNTFGKLCWMYIGAAQDTYEYY